MPRRLLVALILVVAVVLVRTDDASACGAFAAPPTEKSLAATLPFLTVEQVLILWDKATGMEDFIRETRFDRAGQPFGFVVPTPTKPEVFAAKPPFDALREAYAFEDPNRLRIGSGGGAVQGGGKGDAEPAVVVLSKQRIGSFTAFTLAAKDSAAFDAWLRENGFAMAEASKPWTRHYVDLGFFFVALRYDAPRTAGGDAGAPASMTSETVRIRFKTPNPYYPYMEPAHESGAPGPERRMLTGWLVTRDPMKPVAFHPSAGEKRAWQRPWREGARYETTSEALSPRLGDLGKLLPSSSPLVVQTFRDLKVSREGYGDVFLVPERAESEPERAAALEERRHLLGAVDPTLLASEPDAGAGVLVLLAALALARRARGRAVLSAALIVAAGCRSRETSATPDAAVEAAAAAPSPMTRADREKQVLALLAGASDLPIAAADEGRISRGGLAGLSTLPTGSPKEHRGDIQVGGASQQGASPITNADRVVAGLRPRLRICYERGLDSDPKMEGKLTFTVEVAANGEVTAAAPAAQSGLAPAVVTCSTGVFRRAMFDAPGAPATLTVPVTYRLAQK